MTSEKWTPGPWRIGKVNYADIYSAVPDAAPDGLVALAIKGLPETCANAHLIAAAPDEDAALVCCVRTLKQLLSIPVVPHKNEIEAAIKQAEAAMRKARGERGEVKGE